jgi:RNA polymerase sigma factor (sigma-70 family)
MAHSIVEDPPENGQQTDQELIRAIARGGTSPRSPAWQDASLAFQTLYDRLSLRLLAYLATRVSSNDIDDLHQAVWQRVWQQLATGTEVKEFRKYLFKTAHNLIIDEYRKMRPRELGDTAPTIPADEQPEQTILADERSEILENCLRQLDSDAAAVVRARLQGDRYDEICEQLGMDLSRAYKLFHLAKEQLTTCVGRALR